MKEKLNLTRIKSQSSRALLDVEILIGGIQYFRWVLCINLVVYAQKADLSVQ